MYITYYITLYCTLRHIMSLLELCTVRTELDRTGLRCGSVSLYKNYHWFGSVWVRFFKKIFGSVWLQIILCSPVLVSLEFEKFGSVQYRSYFILCEQKLSFMCKMFKYKCIIQCRVFR